MNVEGNHSKMINVKNKTEESCGFSRTILIVGEQNYDDAKTFLYAKSNIKIRR